jgi:hypothetical protein
MGALMPRNLRAHINGYKGMALCNATYLGTGKTLPFYLWADSPDRKCRNCEKMIEKMIRDRSLEMKQIIDIREFNKRQLNLFEKPPKRTYGHSSTTENDRKLISNKA